MWALWVKTVMVFLATVRADVVAERDAVFAAPAYLVVYKVK